jgi:hypothetical protein
VDPEPKLKAFEANIIPFPINKGIVLGIITL